MKGMRKPGSAWHVLWVCVLLLGGAGHVQASNIVIFGDSLSDAGNAAGFIGDTGGFEGTRFSDGIVWHEYLAETPGTSTAPSLLGGTNYAFGGARAVGGVSSPDASAQLGQYFSGPGAGGADPDALYISWFGGNDMRDVISDTGSAVIGGTDPAQALNDAAATVNTVISAYGNALARLLGAGAKTLLVPNLPDLGAIPETAAQEPEAQFLASTLTGFWNAGIVEMTAGLSLLHGDAEILLLDVNALFDQILVDPGGFGFSNVTDGCILLPDPPETCAGFAFWDAIHPTTQAHALVGQAAADLLEARAVPAPAALMLMLVGIAGVVAVRRRRMDARLTAG